MQVTKLALSDVDELTLVKLAREIAKDIHPIESILERAGIDARLWQDISERPRFLALLQSEIEAWQGAGNTAERTKLKSMSMIEEALPEFFERMHDPREPLIAKAKVFELVSKVAGAFASEKEIGGGGEGVKITINLGGDSKLTFEKDVTPQVIEGEIAE